MALIGFPFPPLKSLLDPTDVTMSDNSKYYQSSGRLISLLSLSLSFSAAFRCQRSITHLSRSRRDALESPFIIQESDETLVSVGTSSRKHRVIIIGAGVGGLASAARIAAETRNWNEDVEIVVVEKNARDMIGSYLY